MANPSYNVIIKHLMEFGLSEKEAQIYLALLKLEIGTATEISETADINRSSTYVVLESLKKKGLISESEDKKVQRYVAITPEILLQGAKEKAQKAEDVKNKIGDIVPELKALHKDTKQKPKVRVFEGKQGLIAAFEDTLESKEKLIRVSSSVENLFNMLPDYFPEYVQRRNTLGIKMYSIHPDGALAQKITASNPKIDKPLLILPQKYQFPADICIYDDKISYLSTEKGGSAIVIESKEMAEVMKSIFDLAYEEAKRMTKIGEYLQEYKETLHTYKDPLA
jgi:HTH-type transcriptional regulator, sugar sensing transcriptional regulator